MVPLIVVRLVFVTVKLPNIPSASVESWIFPLITVGAVPASVRLPLSALFERKTGPSSVRVALAAMLFVNVRVAGVSVNEFAKVIALFPLTVRLAPCNIALGNGPLPLAERSTLACKVLAPVVAKLPVPSAFL